MQIKLIIEAMKHWRKGVGHHVYATRITRTSDGSSRLLGVSESNVRMALQGVISRQEIYQIDCEISWREYQKLDCAGMGLTDLVAFVKG